MIRHKAIFLNSTLTKYKTFSKLSCLLTFLFFSCNTNPNAPYNDTPTSGKVNIAADETLRPLVDAELDTFHGLYRYAFINMRYKHETELFKDLLNDSVKVIVASRKLKPDEQDVFKSRQLVPVTTKIAVDALALIINRENKDSLLKISQLKDLLAGKISSWKQINSASALTDITFVFDNKGSSTVRYLHDTLMSGNAFPPYCFAVNTNKEVLEYVEKNKNAIGVIGVSWIGDHDDKQVVDFLSRIRVMALTDKENPTADDYVQPYQAYISTKQYPLTREVYTISREGRAGLGTGFVSFVAGDAGQRIIRLSGLLPATMPVRIINTN